jgi:hypothetical protein
MEECKMFTKKQYIKIGLVAVGLVLAMFLFIYIMRMLALATATPPRDSALYEVLHQDDEGYWIAVQVKRTEDHLFVPLSYYEEEDKMMVYTPNNVDGSVPDQGDIVRISVDKDGENPLVHKVQEKDLLQN